ncbi:sugar ABC transporter substrate-binding protein [Neobacillus mesonae]|uniref:sugar ABC transporter substrate-binding protein n=1 Tax=Neobacillus mesonae TaxID=1193713 RepID=UPI00203D0F4E|nr:sugar ABC transporter substrate-binding protein [Neobacillus mesonae]MCM3571092.1 sugar ABC transporter substrate-binding protein [Neobacillus mesonae]
MLKKRKFIIVLAAVVSLMILSFISTSFALNKPKIVIVIKNLDIQYWEIVKSGAEKAFQELGVEGKVVAPLDGSAKEQKKLLKEIYKEKPDAVIVSPIDESVIPVLDMFTRIKKIPVILIDQNEPLAKKSSYVGVDNSELGEKIGSLMSSQLHPGNKVAVLGGSQSILVFRERIAGAKKVLKNAGIVIAAEKVELPDDPETIRRETLEMIKKHPDIKGIITDHDLIAIPAIKVLREQNLTIPVIGADGIPDMAQLIQDGLVSATVAQNPYDMGHIGVETALKVIKGESVDKFVNTGVDILIKENLQDRLEFHNKLLK